MLYPDEPLSAFTSMTKRDWIAVLVMQGLIAAGKIDFDHTVYASSAQWAYEIAESMIKESERHAD